MCAPRATVITSVFTSVFFQLQDLPRIVSSPALPNIPNSKDRKGPGSCCCEKFLDDRLIKTEKPLELSFDVVAKIGQELRGFRAHCVRRGSKTAVGRWRLLGEVVASESVGESVFNRVENQTQLSCSAEKWERFLGELGAECCGQKLDIDEGAQLEHLAWDPRLESNPHYLRESIADYKTQRHLATVSGYTKWGLSATEAEDFEVKRMVEKLRQHPSSRMVRIGSVVLPSSGSWCSHHWHKCMSVNDALRVYSGFCSFLEIRFPERTRAGKWKEECVGVIKNGACHSNSNKFSNNSHNTCNSNSAWGVFSLAGPKDREAYRERRGLLDNCPNCGSTRKCLPGNCLLGQNRNGGGKGKGKGSGKPGPGSIHKLCHSHGPGKECRFGKECALLHGETDPRETTTPCDA